MTRAPECDNAGVTPALSVPAGLLGFFFIKTYTLLLQRIGVGDQAFHTPGEYCHPDMCCCWCSAGHQWRLWLFIVG